MKDFKDYFSTQSQDYSKYRPTYPPELFRYLSEVAPSLEQAWDVGAGNGQASVALAEFFQKVTGTEPSASQLSQAVPHPKVQYLSGTAEKSPFADRSVDLITVAQAFHWFQQEHFFAEVRRVAKPQAILAIWCYELSQISPEVDAVVMRLYRDILGSYWDTARKLVEEGYRKETIPFQELEHPTFLMSKDWSMEEFMGYLGTWSALQKYKKEKGQDPRELVWKEMAAAWGEGNRKIHWPLPLRVFRITN